MKKFINIFIVVAIVAVAAYIIANNKAKNQAETAVVSAENASVSVRVDTVQTKNINADFVANGTFAPLQELRFSSENSGRVARVLVDEGDQVRIGQTLAVIKGDRLSVDVQSARAAHQTAQADMQRYENAFETGGVTRQQLDQAKLALSNAKARLDQANITYGDATIKATINGVVNRRMIEPGSVVAPGTELFEIVNVSKLLLKVTVNESQVPQLKVGQEVAVNASVFADKSFTGRISFIAPKADASLNFPIEIEIANTAASDLKAGMYGTALFTPSSSVQEKIRVVNRNAFVGGLKANQVFVVRDQKATLTKITSGRIFGEEVEVLNGLQDGDLVVVSGQINLVSGNTVTIIQ